MQENQHLELQLYFGLCCNRGCPEARFYKTTDNPFLQQAYQEARQIAMRIVQQELVSSWNLAIRIGRGRCPKFVRNEAEAKEVIDFAEQNIPNAHAAIELVDCMHGNIRFNRNIRFDGAKPEQLEEIIARLKQSGHQVSDEMWKCAFGFGPRMY